MGAQRKYKCTDTEMLLVAKLIAGNMKNNITELEVLRTNWDVQYTDDLSQRIEIAYNDLIGLDARGTLRHATLHLLDLQKTAYKDMLFLKTEIQQVFVHNDERLSEILNLLGYKTYWEEVRGKKQEVTSTLLYVIKHNINTVRQELETKGVSPALLDRIISAADTYTQANTEQEEHKSSSKGIAGGRRIQLNDIYDEVIGISKLARLYYQEDLLNKNKFTFSYLLKQIR